MTIFSQFFNLFILLLLNALIMNRKSSIVTLVIVCVCGVCECKYGYVVWDGKQPEVRVTDYYADVPDTHAARAVYSNEINTTGWALLEIYTSKSCSDRRQAYAAGFLEGYLTRDLIWMHWQNMLKGYCYNKIEVCSMIEDFVDKNEDYIYTMVSNYPNDPYWYQLKLYYIQIEGLAAGYNRATARSLEQLTKRDILWINMLGDLDELAFALTLPRDSREELLFGEHCTGLVKLLPGLRELYTSHVTWNSYQSMLRILKMYVLNVHVSPDSEEYIPGRKMAMSSYPAFVQSTDDFYIISSGLVPAETTIGNSNRSLFLHVQPDGQILEYARAMVANRLARDGQQWVDTFRRYNSGTYNNQWYIVDYNKFRAASPGAAGSVEPGLLWVLEQLPGYVEAADLTAELVRTSYFPSYNMAYFPRVFKLSGGDVRVRTYGDWFAYHTNPRAKILKKKQATVHNLRDMYHVMRYNDFKFDPLSRCAQCVPPYSACNAVAARNDLNPANGTYPFRRLGHSSHGATDAKVTSSRLRRAYLFLAEAGPTYNLSRGIPPFAWSQFDLGSSVSHEGHPDLWVFKPIVHRWEWV